MIRLTSNHVSLDYLQRLTQTAMRRLPPLLGADAVREIKKNFRAGGFIDQGVTTWPARKGNTDPGRGVLIGKGAGHLFKDIRILGTSGNAVTVGTTLPYARIHNEGGEIAHPGGTAWFKKKGKTIWVRNTTAANLATAGRILPRTKPHQISIPKRQFMGHSMALSKSLRAIVQAELRKIRRTM